MKTILAKVISNKMNKTVVVARTLSRPHPLYKKMMRHTHRLKAHTDIQLVSGDMVKIVSTKPRARSVHHQVVEKVNKL